MKTCTGCGTEKQPDKFGRDASKADGLETRCRDCRSAAKRAARLKKRQVKEAAAHEEYMAARAAAHEEYMAAWAAASHEEAMAEASTPPVDPAETARAAFAESATKRDLRREHTALLKENAELRAREAAIAEMRKAPEILVYKQAPWARCDALAVAVASDWHIDEPVVSAAVHGLNEYNLDIAKERSRLFFQNLLKLTNGVARDSKVSTVFLAALGDFFSGHIHEELKHSTLLAPGEAARFAAGLLCSGIDFLLANSEFNIEGEMIPGNHGRMTHQMWFSNPAGTSLETVMYHLVAGRYDGNPRVRLHVSEHAMVYRQVFEKFTMRLLHGYEIKYGGGVGGITIPLNKAIAQWDIAKRADLTVVGHFHQFFDGGNFFVNDSLIGYNTYAQAIKAKFGQPRQGFFLVHARHGGEKALTAPIWVTP